MKVSKTIALLLGICAFSVQTTAEEINIFKLEYHSPTDIRFGVEKGPNFKHQDVPAFHYWERVEKRVIMRISNTIMDGVGLDYGLTLGIADEENFLDLLLNGHKDGEPSPEEILVGQWSDEWAPDENSNKSGLAAAFLNFAMGRLVQIRINALLDDEQWYKDRMSEFLSTMTALVEARSPFVELDEDFGQVVGKAWSEVFKIGDDFGTFYVASRGVRARDVRNDTGFQGRLLFPTYQGRFVDGISEDEKELLIVLGVEDPKNVEVEIRTENLEDETIGENEIYILLNTTKFGFSIQHILQFGNGSIRVEIQGVATFKNPREIAKLLLQGHNMWESSIVKAYQDSTIPEALWNSQPSREAAHKTKIDWFISTVHELLSTRLNRAIKAQKWYKEGMKFLSDVTFIDELGAGNFSSSRDFRSIGLKFRNAFEDADEADTYPLEEIEVFIFDNRKGPNFNRMLFPIPEAPRQAPKPRPLPRLQPRMQQVSL